MEEPFTLLARIEPAASTPTRSRASSPDFSDQDGGDMNEDAVDNEAIAEDKKHQIAKLREEKLQGDIFILKKLNTSFELFHEALQETGTANERVAAQLEQTDALLNKYIGILSKSEDFSRIIFDEEWEGAEADDERMEKDAIERARREAREAEEAAHKNRQELARLEQERQEELKRMEKERLEREKSERAIRGGLRGARGTRAPGRGVRGVAPSRIAPGPSRGISKQLPSTVNPRVPRPT